MAATAIEAWDERRATPEGRDDWLVPHPAVAADGRPSVRAAHSGAAQQRGLPPDPRQHHVH